MISGDMSLEVLRYELSGMYLSYIRQVPSGSVSMLRKAVAEQNFASSAIGVLKPSPILEMAAGSI